ncbi:outer membrane transport energization protein TonB [Pseudoxanthomonas indica]|uniref:Outer membrane transport energization protein TonB n=2 Tax=Pseudoxanthomonas indica TaxID=428993 RepID=A0A1T5KGY8_9GAMM|nr:hypothetical protein GCM10007235_21570 [Pseudoxanthomonas indica]SKC62953.1 outer membrane transport energization protein TonB [Pseudoxanthomonas indica]
MVMSSQSQVRRILPWVLGMAVLLASLAAWAGNASSQRKLVEMSMLVTGELVIAADGSVSELQVDQREKLPPGVLQLVDQAKTQWRFEPILVDGVARNVRSRMSLRVAAHRLESGDYSIGLRSAYFGKEALAAQEKIDSQDTTTVRARKLTPPAFPQSAGMVGGRGIVYLVVRVGSDGTVTDTAVEQVNLQVLGDDRTMKMLRKEFGNSALRTSKYWTFDVPTTGEMADDGAWAVRIPVSFQYPGYERPGYGEWEAYVPGPRQSPPWAENDDAAEAMIAGGIYPVGQGLRLLTPLQSI